jgi:hypothetical protein
LKNSWYEYLFEETPENAEEPVRINVLGWAQDKSQYFRTTLLST